MTDPTTIRLESGASDARASNDDESSPWSDSGVPTILIVDDEPAARRLHRRFLIRLGFRVQTAANPAEAMDIVLSERLDLILLDLALRDGDGFDVLRAVRTHRSTRGLPVIVVSGVPGKEAQALDYGANGFVAKPFEPAMLAAQIDAQLKPPPERPGDETPSHSALPVSPGGPAAAGPDPQLIGDRYRLGAQIGEGCFGNVYRARDLLTDREVAVKLFKNKVGQSQAAIDSFEREAHAMGMIQHLHVAEVHGFGVDPQDRVYLVTELLRGPTLANLLRREKQLSPKRCARILVPICDALTAAHAEGITHCDVKPDHIFLEDVHGREIPKLIDFGIATLTSGGQRWIPASPLSLAGTRGYMPPEKLAGHTCGPRSDVYSLGVVLYECLTGTQAHRDVRSDPASVLEDRRRAPPRPIRELRPDMPVALAKLIQEAMQEDLGARPFMEDFALRMVSATTPTTSAVTLSLLRCHFLDGALFERFYEIFLASDPSLPPRFANVGFVRQRHVLRNSIVMALLHHDDEELAHGSIGWLRALHGPRGLDVQAEHYNLWKSCFLQACAEFDPEFDAETRAAWEQVLTATIEDILGNDSDDPPT